MNLEKKTVIKSASLVLAAALGFSALSAQAVSIGTYTLSNHPDGSVNPPPYGLRLDGLLTGSSNEEYTFDFNHVDSAMTLTYDGTTIVIDGVAYGGEDSGGGYVANTTALWDIHFEYTVGVSQPGSDGGLADVFAVEDAANFGTISSTLGDLELSDKTLGSYSFRLGDENGGGHRGADGISGWGWLMHGEDCQQGTDCVNVEYSDWLFTAELVVVPVPAAAWLFGSGLLALMGSKRMLRR